MIYINGTAVAPVLSPKDLSLELLCYGEAAGRDSEEIPDLSTLSEYNDFSTYLSYNHTTKKFTVLSDFWATITGWVYSYKTALHSTSEGQIYVNDVLKASYKCSIVEKGSVDGKSVLVHLQQGDTVYVKTPNGNGYPAQRCKIYKTDGINSSNSSGFSEVFTATLWTNEGVS